MNRTLRLDRLPAAGCRFGHVLVADAFNDPERGPVNCASAPLIAAVLTDNRSLAGSGPRVRLGTARPVAPGARSRPSGVMFAVSYVGRGGAVGGFAIAAHRADEAAVAIAAQSAMEWMGAVRSRRLLIDEGPGLCWGGLRARRLMQEASAVRDGPLWVLGHPVADEASLDGLRRLGVVCIEDLDVVPDGGRIVFPAHGASPLARAVAAARNLRVVDATCPLVAAAQTDAAVYADRGDLVAVIGRAGDAVVPCLGAQTRSTVVLVETAADVSGLEWADGDRVSFVIDPAVPAADAMPVLAALRTRFPRLRGHHLDVMCDHGSDRVHAIASVAADSELMLIVAGKDEDEDTRAAVRAAERVGASPKVVRRLGDVGPDLLAQVTCVGLSATLGAPPGLAEQIARALSGLGPLTLSQRGVRTRQGRYGHGSAAELPGGPSALLTTYGPSEWDMSRITP
jgi:4-hydroxy-3-methylbut-2-en-1-yl diphosphate reductase